VRTTRVWRRVLGVEHTVIEWVGLEPGGRGGEVLVAQVRPKVGAVGRCSRCQRRCPGYDTGDKPRRWRGLDLGSIQVFLQATTCRVSCPEHGVVVAAVPWARRGSRFTIACEDTCAWLVCHAALSVVAVLLWVAWRRVSDIVARVLAALGQASDRLAGLRRIGIEEISYRKGARYLRVVTDHDTGRWVWAGNDRTAATLRQFFEDLGPDRAAALSHVSAEGAEFLHTVVTEGAPKAVLCLDAVHVAAWATKALEEVRRGLAAQLRRTGRAEQATTIKKTRWALRKNPPELTGDQRSTLAAIAKDNGALSRAYLRKEQLHVIFQAELPEARALLAGWISWARRSRIPAFVRLTKTITRFQTLILNAVEHHLSNARSEATNTHLRLLTRRGYGYHSPESLIAMVDLTRGGLCPPLPGRP